MKRILSKIKVKSLGIIKNYLPLPVASLIRFLFYGSYQKDVLIFKYFRRNKYKLINVPKGHFSILTTVWNTPPQFLNPLIKSVLQLDGFKNIDWIILDNGSENTDTRKILETLKEYKNIKLLRVEKNIGIIDGLKKCLDSTHTEYFIPIDSDDYLYQDSLTILTKFIDLNNHPDLLYSDEDKLVSSTHTAPYRKPDWDPVLFYHSCYIAHLCCIKTELAKKYHVYTNNQMNGCHDWDTFSRFYLNNHTPFHVPEVLYSWRIHENSTAGNINSKSYIHDSHKNLLSFFLEKRNHVQNYSIDYSPLFNKTPDWRFVRSGSCEKESIAFIKVSENGKLIVDFKNMEQTKKIVCFYKFEMLFQSNDYSNEALTFFELFPDSIGVAGRCIINNHVKRSKIDFKNGQSYDVLKNAHKDDPGYFAQSLKPHTAKAIPALYSFWDRAFIEKMIDDLYHTPTIEWDSLFHTQATKAKKRVIFNPLIAYSHHLPEQPYIGT